MWVAIRASGGPTSSKNLRLRGRDDGLPASWHFTDGETVDRSGNRHDGVLNGPLIRWPSGLRGYAVSGWVGKQIAVGTDGFPAGHWGHLATASPRHATPGRDLRTGPVRRRPLHQAGPRPALLYPEDLRGRGSGSAHTDRWRNCLGVIPRRRLKAVVKANGSV